MDTSEQYIEMCEKAVEIQEDYEPKAGDVYFAQGGIVILPMKAHIDSFCCYECLYLVSSDDYVWLPRQDQLQEMVSPRDFGEALGSLLSRFHYFVINSYKDKDDFITYSYFISMEQLWLVFVMHQKYGKVWNGEDWIEEG